MTSAIEATMLHFETFLNLMKVLITIYFLSSSVSTTLAPLTIMSPPDKINQVPEVQRDANAAVLQKPIFSVVSFDQKPMDSVANARDQAKMVITDDATDNYEYRPIYVLKKNVHFTAEALGTTEKEDTALLSYMPAKDDAPKDCSLKATSSTPAVNPALKSSTSTSSEILNCNKFIPVY